MHDEEMESRIRHIPRSIALAHIALLALASALASAPARAQTDTWFWEIPPAEMAQLPQYCPRTNHDRYKAINSLGGVPSADYFRSLLGQDNFLHLHHYCFGLLAMLRMRRPGEEAKARFHLTDAETNFDYVLDRVKPDFALRPEIFLRRGEVRARLGKVVPAIKDFEASIEAKNDYWPAYAGLAQVLRASGNLARAREVLDAGLERAPQSTTLRRLRTEIDQAAEQSASKAAASKSAAPRQGATAQKRAP